MNKSGIWLNVVLTVYGLATALAPVLQYKNWPGILAAVAIAANVIVHVWFPNASVPSAS